MAKNIYDQDASRAQFFCHKEIYLKNPDPNKFIFPELQSKIWNDIDATFKLRNAILHSMGRPHEQVILNGEVFHAGWEIELKNLNLQAITDAIHKVASPFFSVEIPLDENAIKEIEEIFENLTKEDLAKFLGLR